MAIILKGNLKIGATDVEDEVTSFVFKGTRALVEIPATHGLDSTASAGDTQYMVDISYLQGSGATSLTTLLWDELATVDGELAIEGTLLPGVVGPANPKYTGTLIVSDWEYGGEVNTVGVATMSCRLKARPVKAVA